MQQQRVDFETEHGLPSHHGPLCLVAVVTKNACSLPLTIRPRASARASRHDPKCVPGDAWWKIEAHGVPTKWLRITTGASGLESLLRRYAFTDAQACVHNAPHEPSRHNATAEYGPSSAHSGSSPRPLGVARDEGRAPVLRAVGQLLVHGRLHCPLRAVDRPRDGRREALAAAARGAARARPDRDWTRLCARCLYDREAARSVREALWQDFAIGDDVNQKPELDGQNGCDQLLLLCDAIGLTVRVLELAPGSDVAFRKTRGPPACPDEPHLLVVRLQDAPRTTMLPPRMHLSDEPGVWYTQEGMLLGNIECGHQVGTARCGGDLWCFSDADSHWHGCGPMFMQVPTAGGARAYWERWKTAVPHTRFGPGRAKPCPLNPHNMPASLADHESGR